MRLPNGLRPIALASVFLIATVSSAFAAQPLAGKLFVVDPGHAAVMPDGSALNVGAVAPDGVRESDVTLRVGELLAGRLRALGARVVLTRSFAHPVRVATDRAHDNRARAALANSLGATAFIAVHCDSSTDRTKRGTSVFWLRENSAQLASNVRAALAPLGLGESEFRVRDLAVTSEARVPAVLVELGFISNAAQEARLRDPAFQRREVEALARALERTFGSAAP